MLISAAALSHVIPSAVSDPCTRSRQPKTLVLCVSRWQCTRSAMPRAIRDGPHDHEQKVADAHRAAPNLPVLVHARHLDVLPTVHNLRSSTISKGCSNERPTNTVSAGDGLGADVGEPKPRRNRGSSECSPAAFDLFVERTVSSSIIPRLPSRHVTE